MQSDRITRAEWHCRVFGVPMAHGLERAEREFALGQFWTPWELLDSAYALEWLGQYIARSITTGN